MADGHVLIGDSRVLMYSELDIIVAVGGTVQHDEGSLVIGSYSPNIRVFVEREMVTLAADLTVGELVEGVAYGATRPSPIVLPAGTRVATALLHFYSNTPVGGNSARIASGWVEFGRDILGVVESRSDLDATDVLYGWTGATYTGPGTANRQLEGDPLLRRGRVLEVTFTTAGNNADDLRVFLAE